MSTYFCQARLTNGTTCPNKFETPRLYCDWHLGPQETYGGDFLPRAYCVFDFPTIRRIYGTQTVQEVSVFKILGSKGVELPFAGDEDRVQTQRGLAWRQASLDEDENGRVDGVVGTGVDPWARSSDLRHLCDLCLEERRIKCPDHNSEAERVTLRIWDSHRPEIRTPLEAQLGPDLLDCVLQYHQWPLQVLCFICALAQIEQMLASEDLGPTIPFPARARYRVLGPTRWG